MKTIVMGKKIKRNYELKAERDDDGKLKYKPFIKELNPNIQWEEICSYEGEARCCRNESLFTFDLHKYIYLSEDEGNKAECEKNLKIYIKEFNRERIENDSEAKAYCDLHKLNYEDTDYDELMKYINPNKVLDLKIEPESIRIVPTIPF